jgi:hypothetical protein
MDQSVCSFYLNESFNYNLGISEINKTNKKSVSEVSDIVFSEVKNQSNSNNQQLESLSHQKAKYGCYNHYEEINFKENVRFNENNRLFMNRENVFGSKNHFVKNFNKNNQMTPNLRKNLKGKRSLFSYSKQMFEQNSHQVNNILVSQKLNHKNKKNFISEFKVFSNLKKQKRNILNKSGLKEEYKNPEFNNISKKLFENKNKIKIIQRKRIKKFDARFIKKSNRNLMKYNFRIHKEITFLKNRKTKKQKSKTRKNSFLAGALKGLTFNSKLIIKNNLRVFFKKLRTEFFNTKPDTRKNNHPPVFENMIHDLGNTKHPFKRNMKIRKIAESPAKVLDAPGIQDDFYTHTLEVSSKGILFISLKNTVYSFNLTNNKTQKIKTSFTNSPSSIKISPSGSKVAIGDIRGNLNLIDIEKNCYLYKKKVHQGRLGNIDFLNPKVLTTAGKDSRLNIIDLREKQRRTPISWPFICLTSRQFLEQRFVSKPKAFEIL